VSDTYKTGQQHGQEWAKSATVKEVRRLERRVRNLVSVGHPDSGTPGEFVGVCNNGANSGAAIGIWAAITGRRDHPGQDARDLWEPILVDEWFDTANDDEYACGFIEGATECLTDD